MSRDDHLNYKMFRMVNAHSDAVKAARLDMTVQEYRRMCRRAARQQAIRRAELCRTLTPVLFCGSGMCAAFGTCAWWLVGPLAALGTLALAAISAAVGFWCDGWSRE